MSIKVVVDIEEVHWNGHGFKCFYDYKDELKLSQIYLFDIAKSIGSELRTVSGLLRNRTYSVLVKNDDWLERCDFIDYQDMIRICKKKDSPTADKILKFFEPDYVRPKPWKKEERKSNESKPEQEETNVNDLVFIKNKEVVTDSLIVAEVFGKLHKDVLRDIRNLSCSDEFSQRNFAPSDYRNERGRSYEKFLIKRDGLVFLIMGYTGEKAAEFKEKYIAAFNQMEEQLKSQVVQTDSYMIVDPVERAKRWIEEEEKRQELEQQLVIQAPKVELADDFLNTDRLISTKQFAVSVGIGKNNFMQLMRDLGIFYYSNGCNVPKSGHYEDCFDVRFSVRDDKNYSVTWIKPSGVDKLYRKLAKHGYKKIRDVV